MVFHVAFYSCPDNTPADALLYRAHFFVCVWGDNPETEFYYAYYDDVTGELLHKSHIYYISERQADGYTWMHDPCGCVEVMKVKPARIRFVIYVRYVGESEWYPIVDDAFDLTYDGLKGQGAGDPVSLYHIGLSRYRFQPTECLEKKYVVGIHIVFKQAEAVERSLELDLTDLDTGELLGSIPMKLTKTEDTLYWEIKGVEERLYRVRAELVADGVLSDYTEFEIDGTKTSPILRYPPLGTVIFSGAVSAQEKEGETVTITVTKPDGTTTIVTTLTKEDLTYSVDYSDEPGTGYKAKARIEEDALYTAAESDEVVFNIGKERRTITLTVTPKNKSSLLEIENKF